MATRFRFDPSVLGRTPEEIADMDADEVYEAAIEEVNRAADLLQAIAAAFAPELRGAAVIVDDMGRTVATLARTMGRDGYSPITGCRNEVSV